MALKKKVPASTPISSKIAQASAGKAPAKTTAAPKLDTPAQLKGKKAIPKPTPQKPKPPVRKVAAEAAPKIPPNVQELVKRAEEQKKEENKRGTKTAPKPTPRKTQGNTDPEAGTRPQAPVLALPARQPADPPQPRPSVEREVFEVPESQLTRDEMVKLSHTAQHDLWRKLNEHAPTSVFVTIRPTHDLPKDVVMRLQEALTQELVPGKKVVREKEVFYCSYCVEWMKFRVHTYTGTPKCIGCGFSVMDYYIRADNGLFNKDL